MTLIHVNAKAPKVTPGQLTALLELGADYPLFDPATAAGHPAWGDLERRRKDGELKSPYLAVGERPLLYLPGASARHWDDREKLRILAGRAFDAAVERRAETLVFLLDGALGGEAAEQVAEGVALRAYRFKKYKQEDPLPMSPQVHLVVPAAGLKQTQLAVGRREAVCASINHARDLVNEPGSVATPEAIEKLARKVARTAKLKIEVLDARELKRQGYEALLAVGKGAVVPPRMIVLKYEPSGQGRVARGRKRQGVHLGLLGKGVTFDTGGISIKPSQKLWEMKMDMAGAAAVLFAMEAIAIARVPLPVTGVMVLAQNAVDANSTLPGDVFRARNGKFVHVDNTDAEGRLILTDGMWRMGEEKVTHLVDVATLTGAVVRALGHALTGAFGATELVHQIEEIAAAEGEPVWRLPMVEEYTEWLKTDVADINNVTSAGLAGASTAALFLREFVPESAQHWVHLDIAGSAFMDKDWKYYRPGATGVMVRTFLALAARLAEG